MLAVDQKVHREPLAQQVWVGAVGLVVHLHHTNLFGCERSAHEVVALVARFERKQRGDLCFHSPFLDRAVHLGIVRFVQEQAPCAIGQWQLIARLALCNWHNLEATNRIAVGVASMLLWRLWRRLRHGTAQAQVVVARPRRWAAAGGSVGGVLVGRVWF